MDKPIELRERPLDLWKGRRDAYPNLSIMARRYLGTVAMSVPSEHLFSVAGMTVSTKQAALDPVNVEKLVFLRSNLEMPHLGVKHAKCTCTNCKPVVHLQRNNYTTQVFWNWIVHESAE